MEHCGILPYGNAKITINQTVADPFQKVTIQDPENIIQAIRDNSHRVLAKKTESGVCTYCKLRDDNSHYFYDGEAADLEGTMGDVMMKIDADLYFKCESEDTDTISIEVSLYPALGFKKLWHSNWMLGVFEGYMNGNKLYSYAQHAVANNITQPNFQTYATNRGVGYTQVVWQMHTVMGILYYALYANTNCQGSLGYGTAEYKSTGQTSSLGMIDTVGENGVLLAKYQKGAIDQGNGMSINFWGLENWWGNYCEWFGDAKALTAGSANLTVWVPDPTTGLLSSSCSTRVVPVAAIMQSNYAGSAPVKRMLFGEYLDLVNSERSITGTTASANTYYCDNQAMTDINSSQWAGNTTRVVFRSYDLAYPYGGVACALANNALSVAYTGIGARLAFTGQSVEAASVAQFVGLTAL
jgi:hypothetical protein